MKKVIVIVGPTGVGKTKLSIALAKEFSGEIINADSTQVYKGLDIATAKVTEKEKEGISHHLFDIKKVEEDYTVYHYQMDAREKIDDILCRHKRPIMVGGTGLYIKACLYDYQLGSEVKNNLYSELSDEVLYQKLKAVDPNTTIHQNNRKRVIRALNYYEETGCPLSLKEIAEEPLIPFILIGLTTDRALLYERINNRVDEMLENGLLQEAFDIYQSQIRTKAIMTPIGYKELFPYFEHNITLEEAVNQIKQSSRRYAKRQYTWFRHQMDVQWFDVDFDHFDQTIKEVIAFIKIEDEKKNS